MKLNPHFQSLESSYLFTDIARRLAAYTEQNPGADIIRLGIGDVTRPLAAPVVAALASAAAGMGTAEGFHGYGPEQGYVFLREAVAAHYAQRGVALAPGEIFISDGAKSDMAGLLDLFAPDTLALIPDPVYPAYVDSNRMLGRPVAYLPATRANGFLPLPGPGTKADLVYICSPNNPTGAAYTKAELQQWVDFANRIGAVLLFDAAYEAFIEQEEVPHSIYEIAGASECAIEICSLSKTAGFTGTRCGYTIVPKALQRGGQSLNALWNRRQTTTFNEVAYVIQAAAAAVFSPEGWAACMENVRCYKQNAAVLAAALREARVWFCGGVNSPYIWLECPGGLGSWAFFDLLLTQAGVVGTPGAGFGAQGEGYFRLTGFGDPARTQEAAARLKALLAAM